MEKAQLFQHTVDNMLKMKPETHKEMADKAAEKREWRKVKSKKK